MRYLLEYEDPELDSLISDFTELGINKDRVLINISMENEVIIEIHFPGMDKKGRISFSDIIKEISNNKIEYLEAEQSPTIDKRAIVRAKQNFVEAFGDVIKKGDNSGVSDDKSKVLEVIRKTAGRFYLDDIKVDLFIDGKLTLSGESKGWDF